jgi:hypothetical protein
MREAGASSEASGFRNFWEAVNSRKLNAIIRMSVVHRITSGHGSGACIRTSGAGLFAS